MRIRTYTALTLWVFSSAAIAWQPVTYPIRSQNAYQRSIDNAMCYATANKQTKVNMAHESQLPPRQPAATKTSSTGAPSRPPLPSSSFSATPPGTSMPAAASGASVPAVSTTTAKATTAAATKTASSTTATNATATTAAATPASATIADNGGSETAAAGAAPTASASGVKLPPLPAPEPPMTQYWAAWGACMQARGYVVTQ
ncbi:hypothetical protein [Paraburkholderia domus]|uniref:hypothetical protein n=1 Tax=Paraburkholderia domus TaxID=2793075 RepID=UPI001F2C429E|nr:hypothetical protein [Paraburkholderia domus]